MKTEPTAEATLRDTISPSADSNPESLRLRAEDLAKLPPTVREELVLEQLRRQAERGMSADPAAVRMRRYKLRKALGLTGPQRQGRKPDTSKPLWTADQIRERLRKYDRTPFLDLLSAWLECAPTAEAITEFADRWPDRYAASLLSIGKIAGFAERRELTADLTVRKVEDLSDSQLEDHLRQLAYDLGVPMPPLLELRANRPDAEVVEAVNVPLPPEGEGVIPRKSD